jgi:hypothetical protein
MNQEIIRIEFDSAGHPEEAVLLLAIEGELSEQDAERIEAHTRGCRLCQTRLSEVEQGFAVYDEYRKTVLLPELQPDPDSFREFPKRLSELSEECASGGRGRKRTRDFWRRLLGGGAAVRWVSVTAAVMVVVFLVTQTLLNPVRLSAAEFLERAAAFQNPSVVRPTGGRRKKARQRVRISSGGTAVVRDFQWTVGSSIPNTHWQDETDPGKWNAPLTAEGFSQWRNSAAQKNDQVKRIGERWTLDTTAPGNTIREAWIVVRASDFHPLEQHIRFSDDRSLDFQELAFDVSDDQAVKSQDGETQSAAAQQPVNRTTPPAQPAADPNEAEFEIRYVMFQKEWDLGEDLEIARTGSYVAVSGAASSQERAQAMREALSQIAGVRLDISSPPVGQGGNAPSGRNGTASKNPSPLLKDILEKSLPILEQRRDFVDRCLASSDSALAQAVALAKLAERYNATSEAALRPDSQARLREMLRVHLERLRVADAELEPLTEVLAASATEKAVRSGAWRDTVQLLLKQVREQDSLVTALVAGSRNVNLDVASASGRMKFAHDSIHDLLLNAQAQVSASSVAK